MCSQILFLSTVAMVVFLVSARAPSTTTTARCTKTADCPDKKKQCCVYDPSTRGGVCQQMLETGQTCNTKQPYAWVRPVEMITDFDRCPCNPGEVCVRLEDEYTGICSFL
ncbi:hypothetical protein BsWGS_21469 [Bradybaena similaris]